MTCDEFRQTVHEHKSEGDCVAPYKATQRLVLSWYHSRTNDYWLIMVPLAGTLYWFVTGILEEKDLSMTPTTQEHNLGHGTIGGDTVLVC